MAGTLVLLAACSGDRTTGPVSQVQAVNGAGSRLIATPALASLSPATATVAAGGTVQFQAIDVNAAVMDPAAVTWSASGGGTIDATGLFTAGAAAGTFTVTASGSFYILDASGNLNLTPVSKTASVTVGTPTPTPTCTPDHHENDCDKADRGDDGKDKGDNHDGKGEKDGKDNKHNKDKGNKNNKDKDHGK